jgi:hypothetical protein
MSGHICKNLGTDPGSRKMSGRKMKTGCGSITIFLPAIFLLFEVGLASEPGFENVSRPQTPPHNNNPALPRQPRRKPL